MNHFSGPGRKRHMLTTTSLAIAIIVLTAAKPASQAEAQALTSADQAQARAGLHQAINDGKAASSIHLAVRNGKTIFLEAAGHDDIEAKFPLSVDSIVRIYSMTKPLTSAAAMMLYEQGKFGLDDSVARYIPAFTNAMVIEANGGATRRAPPKRPIKIRDVFRHTTGYSYGDEEVVREFYVREGLRHWGGRRHVPAEDDD